MMKNKNYIVAVHFQYMKDEGKLARELFNSGKHFIASIVPNLLDSEMTFESGEKIFERVHSKDNYYPDWAKDIFRKNKDNKNVIWVQEGYRHCCERCFDSGKDAYHEHRCLDGTAQDLEKQIEVIGKGKKLIDKELGIIPQIYCPPNHLFNSNTLKAAMKNEFGVFLSRNGFDYFLPGKISLPMYSKEVEKDSIVIYPETKSRNGNPPVVMVYYDQVCDGKVPDWENLLENSVKLENCEVQDKPKAKVWVNDKLIIAAKKWREYWKNLSFCED